MTPPKPEVGAHVRLFLCSRRKLDGRIGPDLGEGWISFERDTSGQVEPVRWEEVFTYHRIDERRGFLPREPRLPLEGL